MRASSWPWGPWTVKTMRFSCLVISACLSTVYRPRLTLTWEVSRLYIKMVCIASGFPGGASGKAAACQCGRFKRRRFDPWVGKIPWRRVWQPTPVFVPGESHGQKSLEGYSPWGRTRLQRLSMHAYTLHWMQSKWELLFLKLLGSLVHIYHALAEATSAQLSGWFSMAPASGGDLLVCRVLGHVFLAVKLSGLCWLLSDVMKGWDTN